MEQTGKKEGWERALVSVITPVYNVEDWAARCFESILAQTWTNWELLLIDDGSTDGSGAICDAYAARDKRIRVFHQANRGVSAARNVGLDNARGDFVLFADPDDWLAPEMVEGLMRAGRGAELTVCGQTSVYVQEDGSELRLERRFWDKEHDGPFECTDLYYEVLAKTGMMCNKLFRRDVIGELRFNEGMCNAEDGMFIAQALANVRSAILVPEPWYFYFKNRKGNVVSSLDWRTMEKLENVVVIYRTLRDRGEGPCGVHRIRIAVEETLNKIPFDQGKQNRQYIRACGRALRKADPADRLRYAWDPRFVTGMKKRVRFLLETWCPMLAFDLRSALRALRKNG